jgi:hypothetical protein
MGCKIMGGWTFQRCIFTGNLLYHKGERQNYEMSTRSFDFAILSFLARSEVVVPAPSPTSHCNLRALFHLPLSIYFLLQFVILLLSPLFLRGIYIFQGIHFYAQEADLFMSSPSLSRDLVCLSRQPGSDRSGYPCFTKVYQGLPIVSIS